MDLPTARRFVCERCGHVHVAWSARCGGCGSLEGLKLTTLADVVAQQAATAVTASPTVTVPSSIPPIHFAPRIVPEHTRIVLARTEPDLTSPIDELFPPPPEDDDDDDDDPVPMTEIKAVTHDYEPTGLEPLDAVLGGGIVAGSVILLASPPGSGKSSLTLQALVGLGHLCLYASGEETQEQVTATAHRIGAVSPQVLLMAERNLDKIIKKAKKFNVRLLAIDSIQKMVCDDVAGRAGSPTQLKECTDRLVRFAKTKGTKTSVWMIGHITSDGGIQGPKTIEHDVDVVLELSPGPKMEGNERILRCPTTKNRFGPTNVEGHFQMTATGLAPLEPDDPDGWRGVEL